MDNTRLMEDVKRMIGIEGDFLYSVGTNLECQLTKLLTETLIKPVKYRI